jgi:hypothetical protein
MRLFVTTTILFALSILVAPAIGSLSSAQPTEAEVQEIIQTESESALSDSQIVQDPLPTFSPEGEALVARMGSGFLKAIKRENNKWWECGKVTPKEDEPIRAEKIARDTLDALREYDLKWLNPWGVMAVIFSESRGDHCAIGPNSRKAAKDLKLVDEDKPFNQWSKEDIESVMSDPKWKRSRAKIGADLGLGQQIWQRYARILDPKGGLYCRIPTLDEILSVETGPKVVATGMLTRKIQHRGDIRAWNYWPGWIRNIRYDMRITSLIYQLGGKDKDRPVW